MTFFNKKEEVFDIELTPYGRYLLSLGKLKPHSYKFFDEGINYASTDSSSSHKRISVDTPQLKSGRAISHPPATSCVSYGTGSTTSINAKRSMRNNSFSSYGMYELGKTNNRSKSSPGFNLTMLDGTISNAVNAFSSSVAGLQEIPQINLFIDVTASVYNELDRPRDTLINSSGLFSDGTYIKLDSNGLMVHLKEINSLYEKENFIVEAYIEEDFTQLGMTGTYKSNVLLKQRKIEPIIKDGILLDQPAYYTSDNPNYEFEDDLVPLDYLEHYIQLYYDKEIDQTEICRLVGNLEVNDVFIDDELDCPDQRTKNFDLYATTVSDLEDCD